MNTLIRNPFKAALAAFSLLTLSLPALAETQVKDAWVRATVPGQPATGAFMELTASTDSKLIGVASPAAKTVEVHEMSMKGEMMSMKPVSSVELPAGKTVVFDSEGYHVMLIGLVAQVKEGDQIPLILTIQDAKGERQTLEVQAQARALNSSAHDAHAGHGTHAGH
ncbi:copper chaperone PCu(A)C [Pseudomonas sp. DTU_2021_1001937_2_SI_NGA_ILE_001]|uniref:copper chaperone PCu(A)C n=1 Tax=Pseudomonas sp. DTU_2021_1001937_2_SI_NGA_ILE_001 TaxID=3077589 RepID=UPI0028FC1D31|nr:copper chaperone PCu(A)C [Pseudomonas sp. DTU_2021_1001937_2_SI_NGA_ILE_001]WNW10039.1 copper chaperone PCu(A)C [Pseudomonas sp. DTU_2021_1001937_2_SI_NGA_ILE_001]